MPALGSVAFLVPGFSISSDIERRWLDRVFIWIRRFRVRTTIQEHQYVRDRPFSFETAVYRTLQR